MFLPHPVPKTVEDLRQEVSDDNLLALLERKQLAQVKCWKADGSAVCVTNMMHACFITMSILAYNHDREIQAKSLLAFSRNFSLSFTRHCMVVATASTVCQSAMHQPAVSAGSLPTQEEAIRTYNLDGIIVGAPPREPPQESSEEGETDVLQQQLRNAGTCAVCYATCSVMCLYFHRRRGKHGPRGRVPGC